MLIDPNLRKKNQSSMSTALSLFNQNEAEYFIGFAVTRDKKVVTNATTRFSPEALADTMRNFANTIKPQVTESDMVREFMLLFDQEFRTTPTLPTIDEFHFRRKFLGEELGELESAFVEGDLINFADGICDLFYVLHGLVLQSGMQHILSAMMQEVHRANVSKVCRSKEEAEATCEHILETMGESCYIRTKEVQLFANTEPQTIWMVYRERDGKVMKSINWKEPDLKTIIENAQNKNLS